jgi:hypothetical protein
VIPGTAGSNPAGLPIFKEFNMEIEKQYSHIQNFPADYSWTDDMNCHCVVSDLDEQQKRKFKMYVGLSGKRWFVADQPNVADHIYCSDGEHGQGFNGRTLKFDLVGGSTFSVKGPLHSNAGAFYADTAIDFRNKCSTFGVIGRSRRYGNMGLSPITIHGVLYLDKKWTLGEFERIEKKAQAIANEIGEPVVYFTKSKGGSHNGQTRPNNTEQPVDSQG